VSLPPPLSDSFRAGRVEDDLRGFDLALFIGQVEPSRWKCHLRTAERTAGRLHGQQEQRVLRFVGLNPF